MGVDIMEFKVHLEGSNKDEWIVLYVDIIQDHLWHSVVPNPISSILITIEDSYFANAKS